MLCPWQSLSLAGRMPKKRYADPSSPLAGLI
jgi:thiazole synthase ThiGH ThiG subunit